MPQQPRGAQGDVLREIERGIKVGHVARSYIDLSTESGYSLAAVVQAVRALEERGYIRVERHGPGRRNCYTIPSDEQRRVVTVARMVGLIR